LARYVHWQTAKGVGRLPNTTACGDLGGFNVIDTDAVTCPICKRVPLFELTALRHREVVEALSSPKEDHPCLNPHRR
jgi:hypothetical protein